MPSASASQFNPYIGPQPYQKGQKDLFFGRDEEADVLLSMVISERVVLFYAQTGAGKSSLINARLIPKLEEKRFREPAEKGKYKERPMYKVYPVARVGGALPQGTDVESVQNIYVFNVLLSLTAGSDAKGLLGETLKGYLLEKEPDKHGSYRARYLIIDQFEEILTTHIEHVPQRSDFFKQLQGALEADPKLNVVLAMREDHIAGLDRYSPLLSDGLRNRVRMERLRTDGAVDAIRKPAEIGGRPFENGVDEALVRELTRINVVATDDEDEPGSSKPFYGEFVDPVQLQIVCHRLWKELDKENPNSITEEHLRSFGDIDESLREFYDSTVSSVAKETRIEEGNIRRWFGESLITASRIRAQVNQGRFNTAGLSSKAVDKLLSAYLIRTEEARGGRWIELSHDRFIDPILESNNEWLSQGKSPLAQPAKAWFDHKKDDSYLLRGQRLIEVQNAFQSTMESLSPSEREFLTASINAQLKRSRGMYGLVFFLILGLAAISVLWLQARRDAEQARNAEENANEQAEVARLARVEALLREEQANRTLQALFAFLPPEQAAEIAKDPAVFQQFVEANQKRLEILKNANQTHRNDITIQYFSRDSDPQTIIASLQALGFRVQVRETSLDEVRTNSVWFSKDVAVEDVRLVALTLQRAGLQIKLIRPFRTPKGNKRMEVGGKKALSDQPSLTIDEVSNYSIPQSRSETIAPRRPPP